MNSMDVGTDSTRDILPQIADHVLIRRIGQGAYGEVWLAKNVIGGFRAAKVIYRRSFANERPFHREFEGICKFEPISRSHPGLVTILQVGQNEQAGYFYYVMELADDALLGRAIEAETYIPRTLKEELANHPHLPLNKSLHIALSLTSALAHLHAQGLIHRDIKPSNIIIVDGVVKLADVGLITEVGAEASAVGSVGFMPPEGPGDPTGDIFSLGKVFYELFMKMPCKHFPELPGAAEEFTSVPGLLQINNLILKACHQDPRQRFHNAHELHKSLLAVSKTVAEKLPGTGAAAAGDSGPSGAGIEISMEMVLPESGVRAGRSTNVVEARPANGHRPGSILSRRSALLALVPAAAGAAFFFGKHANHGSVGSDAPNKATNAPLGPRSTSPPPNSVPPPVPVVVLMDTTAPRGVYDEENKRKGGITNAEELKTQLRDFSLDRVAVQISIKSSKITWRGENDVLKHNPALVVIHRSAFFHPLNEAVGLGYPEDFADDPEKMAKWQALYDAMDDKLACFMGYVGTVSPRTKFLIYSRGTEKSWQETKNRDDWVNDIEARFPPLKGRIHTMLIPGGAGPNSRGTFKDEKIAAMTRERIAKILDLPLPTKDSK